MRSCICKYNKRQIKYMKNKRIILIIIAICLSCNIKAQDIIAKSSNNIGAAGILSIDVVDVLQSINPSIYSNAKGLNVSVSYTLPYHLTDLGQAQAKAVYSFPWATVHASVNKNGCSESSFTSFGGGLSRSFGFLGIGIEYNAIIHQMPFSERCISSFSRFGFHAKPNDKWTLAVAVHNIEKRGFEYEYYDFDIESYLFASAKWKGNSYFSLLCEVEKGWNHDANYKVATTIFPCKQLNTTIGFATLGHSLSAGIGYQNKLLMLHVGISYHEQLGVTSSASVTIHNIFNIK